MTHLEKLEKFAAKLKEQKERLNAIRTKQKDIDERLNILETEVNLLVKVSDTLQGQLEGSS